MHRIDGAGATAQNQFTAGDPANGVPATVVTPEWANALQEELAGLIEAAGITLNKPDNTQLLQAVRAIGSRGALLSTTNDHLLLQTPAIGVWSSVPLSVVVSDTDTIVSGSTMVVPSGVSEIEVAASLRFVPGSAGYFQLRVMNITTGAVYNGMAIEELYSAGGVVRGQCQSGRMTATAGDVFELQSYGSVGYTIDNYFGCWASMRIIK